VPSDDDVTSAVEETVAVTARVPSLDEADTILQSRRSGNADSSIQVYVDTAERHWNVLRAEMQRDVKVVAAVCEQLARVRA
jgi:hypothetical protein